LPGTASNTGATGPASTVIGPTGNTGATGPTGVAISYLGFTGPTGTTGSLAKGTGINLATVTTTTTNTGYILIIGNTNIYDSIDGVSYATILRGTGTGASATYLNLANNISTGSSSINLSTGSSLGNIITQGNISMSYIDQVGASNSLQYILRVYHDSGGGSNSLTFGPTTLSVLKISP